jgi:hypothetical protein
VFVHEIAVRGALHSSALWLIVKANGPLCVAPLHSSAAAVSRTDRGKAAWPQAAGTLASQVVQRSSFYGFTAALGDLVKFGYTHWVLSESALCQETPTEL